MIQRCEALKMNNFSELEKIRKIAKFNNIDLSKK